MRARSLRDSCCGSREKARTSVYAPSPRSTIDRSSRRSTPIHPREAARSNSRTGISLYRLGSKEVRAGTGLLPTPLLVLHHVHRNVHGNVAMQAHAHLEIAQRLDRL